MYTRNFKSHPEYSYIVSDPNTFHMYRVSIYKNSECVFSGVADTLKGVHYLINKFKKENNIL